MKHTKRLGTNGTKRAVFLEALGCLASITAACKIARIPRRTVYNWRSEDEQFATHWDKAIEMGINALEDEAIRRAMVGTKKPVFWKGRRVGYISEMSDTLIMFMLKAHRPKKFRENVKIDAAVSGGVLLMTPVAASTEEWIERHGGDRRPDSASAEDNAS